MHGTGSHSLQIVVTIHMTARAMIDTYMAQTTSLTHDADDARLEVEEEGVGDGVEPLQGCRKPGVRTALTSQGWSGYYTAKRIVLGNIIIKHSACILRCLE